MLDRAIFIAIDLLGMKLNDAKDLFVLNEGEIEAKIKGFEGEACGECGNFTLVRNGTCMKCNTCGSTSGCS